MMKRDPRSFSSDRHRRDWESYHREWLLDADLDDRERMDRMEEMYSLYVEIQKTKSPQQLAAEARAERRLNAWNLNPRYRSLLEKALAAQDAD
jgi:DNA-binding transcriptional regulator YbjK